MKTNLPTTPGPYWWREKDGDEWELVTMTPGSSKPDSSNFWCIENAAFDFDMGGQWAKAHSPDEGIEAWAVFSPHGILQVNTVAQLQSQSINRHAVSMYDTWSKRESIGYTCEPVIIFRKEKE